MDGASLIDVSYLVCNRCGFWYRLNPVPVSYHLVRFTHVSEEKHEVEYDEDASRARRIDGDYRQRKEWVRGRIESERRLIVPARYGSFRGETLRT